MLAREIRWVMETLLQEYGRDHVLVKDLINELEERFTEQYDLDWSKLQNGAITVNPSLCPWCGNQGVYDHNKNDYECINDECEAVFYRYDKVIDYRINVMGAAGVSK